MSSLPRAWCPVCREWQPIDHGPDECADTVRVKSVPRLHLPEGDLPEWREPDVDWADANADADYRAAGEQP